MVHCIGTRCLFEITCPHADDVRVCGDGLAYACDMQRNHQNVWFARLILPIGRHTFRYLAKRGADLVCVGQEEIVVHEAEPWHDEWESLSTR